MVGFESNEFFKRSNATNDVGSNCSDWVATDQQQKIRSGLDFAEKQFLLGLLFQKLEWKLQKTKDPA